MKLFRKIDEYVKDNGVKVTRYKPVKDIYILAIDLKTGKVDKKRILEYSKHENIKMYRVEHPAFETFWVSEDHSLVVYDYENQKYRKIRPVDITKSPEKYALIQYRDNELILIPAFEVNIKYDPTKTVGYDFTVEDYYTFATADGVFVQDTMWFARVESDDLMKCHITQFTRYDHNDNPLYTIRHEMIVGGYRLTTEEFSGRTVEIESLQELPETFDISEVVINGNRYKYGVALLNKWAGFTDVRFNEVLTKKSAKKLVNMMIDDSKSNEEFYDRLHTLARKLFFYASLKPITVNLDDLMKARRKVKELPHNPIVGSYLVEMITDQALENISGTDLDILYKSGSRLSREQFRKACVIGGYVADVHNKVLPKPIMNSVIEGLPEKDFFLAAQGTRKALIDKSIWTPRSGYLERTLVLTLTAVEISEDDCGDEFGLKIKIPSQFVKYFKNRYWRYPGETEWRQGQPPAEQDIELRSPITCKAEWPRLCAKCAGKFPLKHIGVIAAQCIAERLTQLILRTFHTSGAASLTIDKEVLQLIKENIVDWTQKSILLKKCSKIQRIIDVTNPIHVEYKDDVVELIYSEQVLDNADIIERLNTLKSLFRETENPNPPQDVLLWLLKEYTKIGDIFAVLIEVLLSMLYWYKDGNRYVPFRKPALGKLIIPSLRRIPGLISTCLGMLYMPNYKTFLEYLQNPTSVGSIHEILWERNFDYLKALQNERTRV